MLNPKGYVVIKKKFDHTKLWPSSQLSLKEKGYIDMEKEYKEALAGKMVMVMDIAVDGSGYLVLGESSKCGGFIWNIEKGDTVEGSFVPIIKKNGVIMPAGLDPLEEMAWMAEGMMGKGEFTAKDALSVLKTKIARKETEK